MAKGYTTDQFWQIYKTLPESVRNALGSAETAENIDDIVTKNGLGSYQSQIVDICGQVFLGITLPQDIQEELQKLGIAPEAAKAAAQQLNGLLFYPIKTGLEKLHRNVARTEKTPERIDVAPARHNAKDIPKAPPPSPPQEGIDEYIVEQAPKTPRQSKRKPIIEEPTPKAADQYRELPD